MKKKLISVLFGALILAGCGEENHSVMPKDDFLVIAHRGASAYAPENTLASYGLAEDMDADYVELDIHLTKDSQLAVMHDKDVSGTTEGKGEIGDYTLDELKQLSADFRFDDKDQIAISGSSEEYAVPELSEVFSQFGEDMNFIIELKDPKKYPGIEEKLVEVLKEYEMIDFDDNGYPRVVIQSFEKKGLQNVHELNPDIPLLKIISFDDGEQAKLSKKEIDELVSYTVGIGVDYEALTPSFISKMNENGLLVYAYTVNDAEAALKMKEMGANGIITDRPDLARIRDY